MAEKRNDYFEAGTLSVWDVDPLARSVALYLPGRVDPAALFTAGQVAHAEPALPGWRIAVDEVFAD